MPAPQLKLAPGVALPVDAVTETFGWIGNRGSGKTYGAKVMAEEMLAVGAQVVVIDPVDAWWGLRYGAERGESGLPIYVFGGAHGDAPLESTAGALLADVVVEQGISAVFSLRHLPKARQRAFVRDFAERLYLRKGEDQYRTAVHVFIEEAHTFAPQMQSRGEDLGCLGAIQDLVLQGRGSGIGVSLVTQRVATLSKAVLELAEVMCAFRTTGPNARKALREWFQAQDGEDHLQEFIDGVASLPRGEAWCWSPGYLSLFQRIAIRSAVTFDSSATPPAGKPRPRPKGTAAALDLAALGDQIRATVERAEAEDPKRLRKEITRLAAEVERLTTMTAQPAVVEVEVVREVPVMDPGVITVVAGVKGFLDTIGNDVETVTHTVGRLIDTLDSLPTIEPTPSAPVAAVHRLMEQVQAERPSAAAKVPIVSDDSSPAGINTTQRMMLAALVRHGPMEKARLARVVCRSAKGGTFGTYISRLRSGGYLEPGSKNEPLRLTQKGEEAAGSVDALPQSGRALFNWWLEQPAVGAGMRRILEGLQAAGGSHDRLALAEWAGFEASGGTYGTYLSRLRSLGLISTEGSLVVLDPDLVEA